MENAIRPVILGPLGPPQLACLRSWNAKGYRPGFIHLSAARRNPFAARAAASYTRISPADLKTESGVEAVSRFLRAHESTGIACVSYDLTSWLWQVKNRLPPGVDIWGATKEVIGILESKQRQAELAREIGFSVLPTYYVGKADADKVPADQFPIVIRPDDPTTVRPIFKVEIIRDRNELTRAINACTRLDRPLIAQPYVDGPNFAVHGYRCRPGGRSEHFGFDIEGMSEGVTVSLRPAALPSDLARRCSEFCDRIGIHGVYHFEFVRDASRQKLYFMELNGRLGGTTGKVLPCGYDEPALIPVAFGAVPDTGAVRAPDPKVSVINRQSALRYLIKVLRGRTAPLDYPRGKFVGVLWALAPSLLKSRDEVFRLTNPVTILAYLTDMILGKFPNRVSLREATPAPAPAPEQAKHPSGQTASPYESRGSRAEERSDRTPALTDER